MEDKYKTALQALATYVGAEHSSDPTVLGDNIRERIDHALRLNASAVAMTVTGDRIRGALQQGKLPSLRDVLVLWRWATGESIIYITSEIEDIQRHLANGGQVFRISQDLNTQPLRVQAIDRNQIHYVDGSVDIFGYPHIKHFELRPAHQTHARLLNAQHAEDMKNDPRNIK